MQRANRQSLLVLLLLTGAALALRLSGAGHMLPTLTEPDAHIVEQVEMLRAGSPDNVVGTKAFGKYPHLLSRTLLMAAAPEPPPGAFRAEDVPERLNAVSEPYRRGRILSALLSVLILPGTWLLARRFFGPWESLWAAALVAVSLLHVNFSWQARPHAALASFTTLALLAILRLARTPTVAGYLLAGSLTALAIACLHNGLLVLPAALVAHWLARPPTGRGRHHLLLLVPLGLMALAVRGFYPFLFASGGARGAEFELAGEGLAQAGHHFRWSWLDGGGFAILWRDLLGHDPVLLALVVLGGVGALGALIRGLGHAAPSKRRDLLVVLACFVPYLLVLGVFRKTYERFQLPLLPGYALLAVVALRTLADGLERVLPGGADRQRARTALALALLALPTVAAVRLARLNARADTAQVAAAWIGEHLAPETERILVRPGTSLPEAVGQDGLPEVETRDEARRQPWQYFLRTHRMEGPGAWQLVTIPWRADLATGRIRLRDKTGPEARHRFDQMIDNLESGWALLERGPDLDRSGFVDTGIDARGEVVARFGPAATWEVEAGGSPAPRLPLGRGYQNEPLFLRALFADHWGPTFDLVRIAPPE